MQLTSATHIMTLLTTQGFDYEFIVYSKVYLRLPQNVSDAALCCVILLLGVFSGHPNCSVVFIFIKKHVIYC